MKDFNYSANLDLNSAMLYLATSIFSAISCSHLRAKRDLYLRLDQSL